MQKREVGLVNSGKTTNNIEFVNGLLNIGSPRAIPIINAVKKQLETKIIIIDAPPGNSCPVIETISDSDFCILVTEPTPFGLWDLRIAVKVANKLGIPNGVIINRYGLGYEKEIEDFCRKENIPVLMKIPFDRKIAEAYSQGIPLAAYDKKWLNKFKDLYERITVMVKEHG